MRAIEVSALWSVADLVKVSFRTICIDLIQIMGKCQKDLKTHNTSHLSMHFVDVYMLNVNIEAPIFSTYFFL